MSVTKRVRFEVLRRDEHTCQYCGGKAPDVVLTVDHVIPSALGGPDDPSNLVAACRDCNAGKSSIQPDSPIVAAVGERSAEYALMQINRAAQIDADLSEINEYRNDFLTAWNRWHVGDDKEPLPLARDWKSSLETWWRMSIPPSLIREAVEVAMTARGVAVRDTFRYFAGVVWKRIETYSAGYPSLTNHARLYTKLECEGFALQRHVADGQSVAHDYCQGVSALAFLRHHIDGTTPPQAWSMVKAAVSEVL